METGDGLSEPPRHVLNPQLGAERLSQPVQRLVAEQPAEQDVVFEASRERQRDDVDVSARDLLDAHDCWPTPFRWSAQRIGG